MGSCKGQERLFTKPPTDLGELRTRLATEIDLLKANLKKRCWHQRKPRPKFASIEMAESYGVREVFILKIDLKSGNMALN